MNKRSHIHKKADSSASNPVQSQLQSRPFIAQAQPQSQKPLSKTETETQEFQQHNSEATKLKLQAKYGTITPEGQERLTVLQAKMSSSLQSKLEHASSFDRNFANIPISRPDASSQQAVQTKLTIGEPGDKYEQEADRVAAQVVNQINAPVSQQAGQNLQREEVLEEEKDLQMKPMLQLQSAKVGMSAAPDLEASIKQARGSGQPLANNIRKPMEQAIGADFSRVKVHTDSQSDQLNRSIQARAFTTGHDVFFRQGEYNPENRGGQELLAHELTHVVQQNGGVVQRKQKQQAQCSQQPVTETPSPSVGESLIQGKFEGGIEGITIEELKEILPSYGVTEENEVKKIEEMFENLEKHPLSIVSVPQLVAKALNNRSRETELARKVKTDLIENAGEGVTKEAQTVTLYRGDSRNIEEIEKEGGFFGRGSAPITIDHARKIMEKWDSYTDKEKRTWAQEWKAQTKAPHQHVPYVATGEEAQKGGNIYKIQVPLTFRTEEGKSEAIPKLGCDQWPIKSATIMAIKMQGGEVVFLTGIPSKYIVNKGTGESSRQEG